MTVTRLLPRFWSVGAESVDLGPALLTCRPGLEDEPTATFLHRLRPAAVADLDAALARAEAVLGRLCPRVFLDGGTPAWVEAELVAHDWRVDAVLQLVLPALAAAPRPTVTSPTVRPVEPGDWAELAALFRADHAEEDRRGSRPVRPQHVTDRVVAARRGLAEPVRYLAAVDDGGSIVGFVAAWPGEEGVGLIEDLFVRDTRRGRGVATALLAHAVAHARGRGAESVVIGAELDDTPKHLYRRLGFVPTEVLRTATAPEAHQR